MGKEIIMYCDIETEKYKFHQLKSPISINDADITKIIVPIKVLLGKNGFKYFIVYKGDR